MGRNEYPEFYFDENKQREIYRRAGAIGFGAGAGLSQAFAKWAGQDGTKKVPIGSHSW